MAKELVSGMSSVSASGAGRTIVFLICTVPILSTVFYGAVDAGPASLIYFITTTMVVIWLAASYRAGNLELNADASLLPILGWVLIAFIQLLPLGSFGVSPELLAVPTVHSLSLDPYATRFFLIRLIACFFYFAACLTFIDTRARYKGVVLTLIIFCAAMAFFGILQWLAKPDGIYGLRPTPQAIPFGPFVNQHHFAALMEMSTGLTLGLLIGNGLDRDKRPLLMIAAGLMVVAVILTGSRGGILSLCGVVAFVLVANALTGRIRRRHSQQTPESNTKQRVTAAAVGVAVIIVAAGVVLFLGGADSLIRGVGINVAEGDYTSGRAHFWSVAWKIFVAHPLIGAGFDAFGVAYPFFDSASGLYRVEQAHNDYLQTMADAGIFGFICLAGFIYLVYKKGLENISVAGDGFVGSAALGALAGCTGIFIHSFFDFPLRTPSNAFIFLLLVTLGIVRVERKGERRPH